MPEMQHGQTDIKDTACVSTICLSLGHLLLDSSNKRQFVKHLGLHKMISIISNAVDDFLASACLASLSSFVQGQALSDKDEVKLTFSESGVI